jgi:hypothetical protein
MKILKRKISNPDDVICIEVIQELITFDQKEKKYIIPADLDFDKIPKRAVDNFWDYVNELRAVGLTEEGLSRFLQRIKSGEIVIECDGWN